MPSTTDYLRNKFMKDGDDGIGDAKTIILQYGGTILGGWITIPEEIQELENKLLNGGMVHFDKDKYDNFWDAVQFLCEEWDYAVL